MLEDSGGTGCGGGGEAAPSSLSSCTKGVAEAGVVPKTTPPSGNAYTVGGTHNDLGSDDLLEGPELPVILTIKASHTEGRG